MEKPSTEVSSRDFLFRGKPSPTRSGPKGDIQRTPAPTDLLRSLKPNPLNALPISKKATPRTPYCSMMGNSNSVFITTAVSPPTTSLPWQVTVGGVVDLSVVHEGSRGPRLRSAKARTAFLAPRRQRSEGGESMA